MSIDTVWDDPAFVKNWNDTYGLDMHNAPIRPGFIFPYIRQEISFTGLNALDLGCGNGNLIKFFLGKDFSSWIGIDSGRAVLDSAEISVNDKRVEFIHQSVTSPSIASLKEQFDLVTSIFLLEELANETLAQFFSNISSGLKKGGRAIIFSNHPARALVEDTKAFVSGIENQKFKEQAGYFDRKPTSYNLSVLNSKNGEPLKANYYHKTLSDIINAIVESGLKIHRMVELPTSVLTLDDIQNHQPKSGDEAKFLLFDLSK